MQVFFFQKGLVQLNSVKPALCTEDCVLKRQNYQSSHLKECRSEVFFDDLICVRYKMKTSMVCSEKDPLSLWTEATLTTSRVDVKWSLQLLLDFLHRLISMTVMFRRRKLTVFFLWNPYRAVCKSALKTNIMLPLFSARALLSPDNKHRAESVYATETKAERVVQAASLVMSWQSRQEVCTLGFFSLMCVEPVIFFF